MAREIDLAQLEKTAHGIEVVTTLPSPERLADLQRSQRAALAQVALAAYHSKGLVRLATHIPTRPEVAALQLEGAILKQSQKGTPCY
ncbi:MAG: hypothetical protein HY817_03925 [Candidatus Abawacabacteria bacterium]|nr:hypothetical protein [Candidatus Abawacabacteria bacterium]